MNTRSIGSFYEEKAVRYLSENGYILIERNFRCKTGEIDIIAIKDNILRFIEVKYRKDCDLGSPLFAVNNKKKLKIRRTAQWYLNSHIQYQNIQCSFDIIAITDFGIEYIFNGFGAM